ncbi:glutaredoxin-like [Melia azedarach]|uniref:Glutaredoxin-like n=1 Tax=Melia azedarach TaxID=155640 RepID=A0ACC1XM22_MELAZ|nr:glutaredoxin-like [Melia azedarach]
MGLFQSKASKEELEVALTKAKEIVSSNPVVVFSRRAGSSVFAKLISITKIYCPYCTRVKQLLTQLGASYKVIELDKESDGSIIQSALGEWTGQRTVPNVFIGGKHIGGCDTVVEKHQEGKLVPLLVDAAAIAVKL